MNKSQEGKILKVMNELWRFGFNDIINFTGITGVKIDTFEACEEINPIRWIPQLNGIARAQKVFNCQVQRSKSEIFQNDTVHFLCPKTSLYFRGFSGHISKNPHK